MPLYETICDECHEEKDIVRTIEKRHETPLCCGVPMRLLISAPNFNVDYTNYVSMHDGTRIKSKKQHRDHLRQHNLVELGNEKPKQQKRDYRMPKHEMENLKKEISQRLDCIPQT